MKEYSVTSHMLIAIAAATCTVVVSPAAAQNTLPSPPAYIATVPQNATPAIVSAKDRVVYHGPRNRPRIALTFDACQKDRPSGYDKKIVSELTVARTPATFFISGRWMAAHPGQTKYLSRIPYFEIANHSYSHPLLTQLDRKKILDEIMQTQLLMHKLTGREGAFFRAPYGKYNREVVDAAASLGLRVVQWDVITADPDPKATGNRIYETVMHRVRNGSIIIMHANGRGWHTNEVLPKMIAELKRRGFEFVTLSKLLESETRTQPAALVKHSSQSGKP